ncbi:MAG: hypothetical protein IAX21_03755 [Candidatus Bathyarchaeota archaeon]|nr:MAG: hypothetical protein IAX21_03755 [Candidatus Bathyarchaeota archaeon]
MPKIMSMKERSTELYRVSQKFNYSGFTNTSKWINRISKDILSKKVTIAEIKSDWDDIELSFRNEFIGKNENWKYRELCYDAIEKIFQDLIANRGIKKSSEAIERVMPALELGNEGLENLKEIYYTLVEPKRLSEKRRFFGLCFMYLILLEGLFDETIRVLYILVKAQKGVDIDYESVETKNVGELKNGLPTILFEGYNSRLRNSIAHARFRFDDVQNKMTFNDIATKYRPAYSETLSIKDFAVNYYDKIDNLCRLRTFYLILLGTRDLIFAPRPFGKTKM